jgi:hypothetical protein
MCRDWCWCSSCHDPLFLSGIESADIFPSLHLHHSFHPQTKFNFLPLRCLPLPWSKRSFQPYRTPTLCSTARSQHHHPSPHSLGEGVLGAQLLSLAHHSPKSCRPKSMSRGDQPVTWSCTESLPCSRPDPANPTSTARIRGGVMLCAIFSRFDTPDGSGMLFPAALEPQRC